MRELLVIASLLGLSSALARAAEVCLSLQNSLAFDRAREPITCGVPLEKGFAASAADLLLAGPEGEAVAAQIQTTSTYGDGSPRWVLLDFLADVPAGGSAVYRLKQGGDRPAPEGRLSCSLRDGVAHVDTGAALFTIDTRRFRLFDSVRIGGRELISGGDEGRGISLETAGGAVIRGESFATRATFEDRGPVRATLCIRGALGEKTDSFRARFVCRLHFCAGLSEVRVVFTLHNPSAHHHPGNIWDLGSGGSLFLEDVSLVVPLAAERARGRVAGAAGAAERIKIYQDSSGGESWRSANHVDKDLQIPLSFRGYRAYRGEERIAAGERIDGWIHARGEKSGVAASVREFWQNFPKALSFEEGRLRIALWPRESAGAHEILGGEQKTHEILLLFHGEDAEDAAVERRLAAFHHPLYAMPDARAVLATRAFWPSAPLDRRRCERLEATCDTAVHPRGGSRETIQTRWEAIDEYGWRHFGDTFADNERAPAAMMREFPQHHPGGLPISHFVNEYDVIYAIMLHGMRRGDPSWMWLADVCARHHADICINHTDEDAPAYSHGPFMHTTHDTAAYRSTLRGYPIEAKRYGLRYGQGGGPNAGHTYVACLAQHYWLTGDRISREAFLEVADWAAESPWFSPSHMGDQRGYGNFLLTFVYAYQMTGEHRYYERAMTLLGWIEKPFAGLGGNLLARAAGRFLDMKVDRGEIDADYHKVQSLLMDLGEHYLTLPESAWSGFLEQRCFHAEVLCTVYLHAPEDHPKRAAFLAAGSRIMDEALDRFPARYVPVKTWVMCFANTGAYLRAKSLSGDPPGPAEAQRQGGRSAELRSTERGSPAGVSKDTTGLLAGVFSWTCSPPLVAPVDRPEDPYHAIKDPTVVHFDGRWYVYATIKCKDRTVMEHLSFTDWKDAGAAPRRPVELVKAYHCAPQILYFRPQKKWYLIYQWGDDSRKYFGPCYSTLEHPGRPETLTKPVMLYPEKPQQLGGWLDFWVIGDPSSERMHLFFTSLDGRMWRAETSYAEFPHGWSTPDVVLRGDIFEASHTYRLKGLDRFLSIVEAQASGGRRYYKAYAADRLDGAWKPLADTIEKPFAGERNVRFARGVEPWTDSISHGELLRDGCDETMTVDPSWLRMLFQGVSADGRSGKGYGGFTWRLGLLEPAGD